MLGDNKDITYFAETDSRNKRVPFGIKTEDRSRHTYIIGKTGMGKSTVLENMAIQDILNGNGLAFLDPHGKTADLFLQYIPEHRIKDVVYFAPFDTDYPISFNVMEDVGADKRHLVANGLMSAFKKIWVDAWSARMEYILNNILLALLEYPDSTLIGVNRMLADKEYRRRVVENITDPSVKAFWTDEYAKYTDRFAAEAAPAIQNKIGQFVSNPLVRNIIGQPKSTFNLRKMMDKRKIIIINLSKGRMGEANANLLGSMIITKIYLAAMSRADSSESVLESLPQFNLYVDEFQNFANESFADILSEARKYKLSLTVAHQYIEQMSEEVRAAVFGNVGTMVAFRVGAYDAEVLEKEFAPVFTAEDLVNLGRFQIYLKLMIDGVSSPPFSATTLPQIERPIISYAEEIVEYSRKAYARPRAVVEEEIRIWHAPLSSAEQPSLPDRSPALPAKNQTSAPKNQDTPKVQASLSSEGFSNKPPVIKAPFEHAKSNKDNMQFPTTNNDQIPEQKKESRNDSRNEPKYSYKNERRDNKGEQRPESFSRRIIPPDVQDVKRASAPRTDAREAELRKAISLDYLKNTPEKPPHLKNDKVQTKEHVDALKQALAEVMKAPPKEENKQDKKEEKQENKSDLIQTSTPSTPFSLTKSNQEPISHSRVGWQPNQSTSKTETQNKKENQPHEVPEDVLRNMLKVE
jgi:hypothetical protein